MSQKLSTEVYKLSDFTAVNEVKAKLTALSAVNTTISGHFSVAKEIIDGAKRTCKDGIQLVGAKVLEAKSQWFLVSMDDLTEPADGAEAEEIERQFWIRPLEFIDGTADDATITFEYDPEALPVSVAAAETSEADDDEDAKPAKQKREKRERKPRKSRRKKGDDGEDAESALGDEESEVSASQASMFDVTDEEDADE